MKINTEASALLAQIRDYQTQISDSRTARSEEKVLSGISEKISFGSQISELVSESQRK